MMSKVDHLSSELATLKGQQQPSARSSIAATTKTPTGLTDYLDRQGLINLRIATEKKGNVNLRKLTSRFEVFEDEEESDAKGSSPSSSDRKASSTSSSESEQAYNKIKSNKKASERQLTNV